LTKNIIFGLLKIYFSENSNQTAMLENTNTPIPIVLNNPNDKFFKGALSLLIVAKPMIEECLSPDLLEILDLDSLEIDPNSYINDELKENFSDVVWSCKLKGSNERRQIAFLFEHKSYKPPYPHFQLNDYQRGSWKMQMAAGQKPVPIIPIVFYHGKDEWINEPFDSYFGVIEPATLRFLPCFDYILINLQDYTDERIKKLNSIYLQKTFLAFKHYSDKNYWQQHIVDLVFVGYLPEKNINTRSFFQMIIVYLTAVSGMTRKEVVKLAEQSNNNLKSEAMSFIDEFIEEGKEIGKEIGKEAVLLKAIINLYKRGMTSEIIAEDLEAPIGYVKQIITDYLVKQQQGN
jgi:predicted transposase/invertase (TIGR01784 family)